MLDGAELDQSGGDVPPWLVGGNGVRIHSVRESDRPRDEPIHLRGEVEMTGEVIPRGFPTLVSTIERSEIPANHSGRWQLADWILSEGNSLAWRVIVNRAWHHVFGQGVVRSTDNFGFTGDPPSHPELLDHLAIRFRDHHRGSFKSLIREMLLSRAWRQSSRRRPAGFGVDPENRLLWRAKSQTDGRGGRDGFDSVCLRPAEPIRSRSHGAAVQGRQPGKYGGP